MRCYLFEQKSAGSIVLLTRELVCAAARMMVLFCKLSGCNLLRMALQATRIKQYACTVRLSSGDAWHWSYPSPRWRPHAHVSGLQKLIFSSNCAQRQGYSFCEPHVLCIARRSKKSHRAGALGCSSPIVPATPG